GTGRSSPLKRRLRPPLRFADTAHACRIPPTGRGSGRGPGRGWGRGYSAPVETSLPRLRAVALSARSFRRLALANALMLIVVVATGTTVRLTGSGLGCEHWPGCQAGQPLPTRGFHSVVEFSNRVVAAITIV